VAERDGKEQAKLGLQVQSVEDPCPPASCRYEIFNESLVDTSPPIFQTSGLGINKYTIAIDPQERGRVDHFKLTIETSYPNKWGDFFVMATHTLEASRVGNS
jgi:hypothetical protein